jgi:hypothetical protein
VIVTSLRKTFKSRHLNSPAGKYVLELNAINRDNDIRKATITIDSQCKQPPSQAKLTLAGGATVTIDVQSAVKGNSKLAVTAFRPDKKSYPKTEWIDLR